MDFELYKEMMEEQGVSQRQRIMNTLDEFEKTNRSDHLNGAFD